MISIVYPKPVRPMSPFRHLSLIAVFVFLHSQYAASQSSKDSVHLFLPGISTGLEGQIVNVPVKVKRFSGLISAQFIIQWDSTRAQCLGADNFGIASISEQGNFGISADKIRFAWFENSLIPQSLDDDATFFNLKFRLIGKRGQDCVIGFREDSGTIFEFLDKDGKDIKYSFKDGTLKIATATSATEAKERILKHEKPYPNPFFDETLIRIDLIESQYLKLDIFNISGENIYSNKILYNFGTQFVHINKNYIHSAGAYFYRLSNSKGDIGSGKIIYRQ
ncbi:MAG: T9SS type A sorting domain-containing protein [Saprospiraceae bacterium]